MRNAPRWATTAGAALLLVTAGCSTGAPAAAPPSTVTATVTVPVTTTVTVAPPVTTWTMAKAGKEYLSYLVPVNKANKALGELPQESSVKATAAACQDVVDAELVLVRQLRLGSWPKEAKPDVARLLDAMGDEIAGYQICANSYTYESIDKGIQSALSAPRRSAAAQMRAALNLPPAS